jgi:hypothetical protein
MQVNGQHGSSPACPLDVAPFVRVHHRETEAAKKTKIQQHQRDRRRISPYSPDLEIAKN